MIRMTCSCRTRGGLVLALFVPAVLAAAAGCQSSGEKTGGGVLRAGLPPKAEMVQEGSNQIVYSADRPGRIYLYDVTRDQVVERYQVRPGQRFAVDAAAGRATLAGNEVSTGKLKAGDTYQIYFLPD